MPLLSTKKIGLVIALILVSLVLSKFIGGAFLLFILLAIVASYGLKNIHNSPLELSTNGFWLEGECFVWDEVKEIKAVPYLSHILASRLSALKVNLYIEKRNGQQYHFRMYVKQVQKLDMEASLHGRHITGVEECVRQYQEYEKKNHLYRWCAVILVILFFAISLAGSMAQKYPEQYRNFWLTIFHKLGTNRK